MSFTCLFALPSAISILLSRLSGLSGHVSPPQLRFSQPWKHRQPAYSFAFDSHGSIIYCIRLFVGFLLISEEVLFLLRSSMRSWWKDAYVGTKAGNQFICHSHLMIPKPTNTFALSHVWLHPQRASYSSKGRTHLFPRHSSRFSRLGPHEHSPRVGSWGITSFDYDTVPSFPCYTYNIDN